MSKSKNHRKSVRAMAAARRYRPRRAVWATKMVERGLSHWSVWVLGVSFLAIPVGLLVAGVSIHLDPSEPFHRASRLIWGAIMTVAFAPAILLGTGCALVWSLERLVSVFTPSFRAWEALYHLRDHPELLGLVRDWVLKSGDANLTKHEYHLIERVVYPAEHRMFSLWAQDIPHLEMDEDFHQVFPVAPRFLKKGDEEKRRDYARQVALLDRQVGHIALARINAHACQMEEVLDDPHEAHLPARARF